MTDRTTDEENQALRLVIAAHDRYLTQMMNASDDDSDYVNASFDLYTRLEEAGFGKYDDQMAMHRAALETTPERPPAAPQPTILL